MTSTLAHKGDLIHVRGTVKSTHRYSTESGNSSGCIVAFNYHKDAYDVFIRDEDIVHVEARKYEAGDRVYSSTDMKHGKVIAVWEQMVWVIFDGNSNPSSRSTTTLERSNW